MTDDRQSPRSESSSSGVDNPTTDAQSLERIKQILVGDRLDQVMGQLEALDARLSTQISQLEQRWDGQIQQMTQHWQSELAQMQQAVQRSQQAHIQTLTDDFNQRLTAVLNQLQSECQTQKTDFSHDLHQVHETHHQFKQQVMRSLQQMLHELE